MDDASTYRKYDYDYDCTSTQNKGKEKDDVRALVQVQSGGCTSVARGVRRGSNPRASELAVDKEGVPGGHQGRRPARSELHGPVRSAMRRTRAICRSFFIEPCRHATNLL